MTLFSFDCRFVTKYWQKVEKCNPKVGANWEILHIGGARDGYTLELWCFGGVGEVGRCAILYIWYGRVAQGGEGFFCGVAGEVVGRNGGEESAWEHELGQW